MSPPHYEKDETTPNTHHVRPGMSKFSMLQQPILLSDWLDLAVFHVLTQHDRLQHTTTADSVI